MQSVVSFAEAKFSNTTVNVVALGGDLLKLREHTLCCLSVPWISQLLKVGSLSFLILRIATQERRHHVQSGVRLTCL